MYECIAVDYINYCKLSHSTTRTLLVLEQLIKPDKGEEGGRPEEFVRLYDILLQNNVDLVAIPGVGEMMEREIAVRRAEFQVRFDKLFLAQVIYSDTTDTQVFLSGRSVSNSWTTQ